MFEIRQTPVYVGLRRRRREGNDLGERKEGCEGMVGVDCLRDTFGRKAAHPF
jgi:hypothetical protein